MRWSQLGFGRTSSTSTTQATPRNLFGFKDGTANLKAEEPATLDEHVWVADRRRRRGRLAGRRVSYLVARRISMTIETWDRQPLREQEDIIGRTKAEGAPLSGGDGVHASRTSTLDGPRRPAADPGRLPRPRWRTPTHNDGVRMLRRGYNFVDGTDGLGRLDAGLFFLAYVARPAHALHPDADHAGQRRRAERVPPAHRLGAVRRPAGRRDGRVRRSGAVRLTRRGATQPVRRECTCATMSP